MVLVGITFRNVPCEGLNSGSWRALRSRGAAPLKRPPCREGADQGLRRAVMPSAKRPLIFPIVCARIWPGRGAHMVRTVAYWTTTTIAALALLGSLSYLTGSEQVVSGFARAGYPQHLRIVLGIAKPAAGIVLLVPGFALLKEWAYAGVTFAFIMAFISASSPGEPVQVWILPLALLALLIVSYFTRTPSRRVSVMPRTR